MRCLCACVSVSVSVRACVNIGALGKRTGDSVEDGALPQSLRRPMRGSGSKCGWHLYAALPALVCVHSSLRQTHRQTRQQTGDCVCVRSVVRGRQERTGLVPATQQSVLASGCVRAGHSSVACVSPQAALAAATVLWASMWWRLAIDERTEEELLLLRATHKQPAVSAHCPPLVSSRFRESVTPTRKRQPAPKRGEPGR